MSIRRVLLASAFIATGGFLFGYMIGINSNVITKGQLLCKEGSSAGTWGSWGYGQCYTLSALTVGILSSLSLMGAVLSTLVTFRYADNMGRKLEVQVAAVLYLLGSVMAAFSPMLWGFAAGIFIYGLGIGFAMHAAPIYIAEISPPEIRGALVSGKEAIIVFGIFLGFASGAGFGSIGSVGWRYMVACEIPFAIALFFGISTIPQSPRFLAIEVARGDKTVEDVSAALQFFRGAEAAEVADEVQMLLADLPDEKSTLLHNTEGRQLGTFEAFRYPRPLVIGCTLVFLQQITGQPSVLYFATNIFKSAGFGATASAASVAVGLVKLLATLFTVWRVDSYGRRVLLMVGIAMMVVALALVGASFVNTVCSDGTPVSECDQEKITLPKNWAYTAVAGLMLYVSGYQVGFGPISWVVISEIFPLSVRGSALSVAAIVNFTTNIIVVAVQPVLLEVFGPAGLFFGFLVLSVLSFIFVYVGMPETRGLSLEEIEKMMKEE